MSADEVLREFEIFSQAAIRTAVQAVVEDLRQQQEESIREVSGEDEFENSDDLVTIATE